MCICNKILNKILFYVNLYLFDFHIYYCRKVISYRLEQIIFY